LANLKITMVKSLIGRPQTERKTARALGLKKPGAVIVRSDTAAVRGQVRKLAHLVQCEEVE